MAEIPYPAVFHDWRPGYRSRVATGNGHGGVIVETLLPDRPGSVWQQVEMTEQDAALLAASLLERAGYKKLSRRVVERVGRD